MTALEIIKKSATLLNEKKVLDDENLNALNSTNLQELLDSNFTINRMFELLKIMLADIATDYVQLPREENFVSKNGVIDMSQVSNLLKIVEVRAGGVKLPMKIVDGNPNVKYDGKCVVKFLIVPTLKSLDDDVDYFKGMIGYDLLVYGLTAMYCLAVGLFDEYGIYNTIYEQKLAEVKSLKILTMPMRSWQ